MRIRSGATLCLVAGFSLASQLYGACTGSATTNPLYAVNNTSWAFQIQDGFGNASIGWFTLSVQTQAVFPALLGKINGVETSIITGGGVTRLAPFTGNYSVSPDCTGGTLSFTGISGKNQYQFVLAGTNLLYLADIGTSVRNTLTLYGILNVYSAGHGTATMLAGPPSCPVTGAPSSLLSGAYSFQSYDVLEAQVGIFTATAGTGATGAIGNGTISGTNLGNVQIGIPFAGSYAVYSDCSGGSMVLRPTFFPIFEFVFAGPGKIYFLNSSSDTPLGYTGVGIQP